MNFNKTIRIKILIIVIFFLNFTYTQTKNKSLNTIYNREKSIQNKILSLFESSKFNKSVALVIGIGDYKESWESLEAPYKDAIRMRDYLIKQAEFDIVITLTNEEASLGKITKYMEEIIPQMLSKNDRFFFYFSGHGTQRKIGNSIRGYLPMMESKRNGWSTMISMDDFDRWNENIQHVKHALFVLDCCFSGLAGRQKKSTPQELFINDLAKYGHHIISAGTENQESYGSLKRWGGSIFTHAFIEGVCGKADAETSEYPKDGIVSLTELYDYIKKRIKKEQSLEKSIDQTPQVAELGNNEGEFFFISDLNQASSVKKIMELQNKHFFDNPEKKGASNNKPQAIFDETPSKDYKSRGHVTGIDKRHKNVLFASSSAFILPIIGHGYIGRPNNIVRGILYTVTGPSLIIFGILFSLDDDGLPLFLSGVGIHILSATDAGYCAANMNETLASKSYPNSTHRNPKRVSFKFNTSF